MIDLWLDDMRPAPPGWVHVFNIQSAKLYLQDRNVRRASLDHDLGACKDCMGGLTTEEWMAKHNNTQMPNCSHFGTGYDLVCWMEETGFWPKEKPKVHSANPAGRFKMQQAIDREWQRRAER